MKLFVPLLTLLICIVPLKSQTVFKDVYKGQGNAYPIFQASSEKGFYFIATNDSLGKELWYSDGTSDGTHPVKDISAGVAYTQFIGVPYLDGDNLFFMTKLNPLIPEYQYWYTDGTESGTVMLANSKKIQPWDGNIKQVIRFKDQLFFVNTDSAHGTELWVTDGTVQGTRLFKDLDTTAGFPGNISNMNIIGDKLYFYANTLKHGNELWVSDGTDTGTRLLLDFIPGKSPGFDIENTSFVFKNQLYFVGQDDSSSPKRLYVTDGSMAGTQLAYALDTSNKDMEVLGSYFQDDSIFIFNASYKGEFQTWISNGTKSGTYPLKSEDSSIRSIFFRNCFNLNGRYVGHVYTEKFGYEIWSIDKDMKHISLAKDAIVGQNGSLVGSTYVVKNNRLFYIAQATNIGTGIWVTDGTEAGTVIYSLIPQNIHVNSIFNFKDLFFLTGNFEPAFGYEIYSFDQLNTRLGHIAHQQISIYPNPAKAGDYLYLSNNSKLHKVKLYDQKGALAAEIEAMDYFNIPSHLSSGIYHVSIQSENVYTYELLILE